MGRCKVDGGNQQAEADRCGEGEPEAGDEAHATLAGVTLHRGEDDARGCDGHADHLEHARLLASRQADDDRDDTPHALTGPTMLIMPIAIAAYRQPSEATPVSPATADQAASAPTNPGVPLSSATTTRTAQPASMDTKRTTAMRSERLATPPTKPEKPQATLAARASRIPVIAACLSRLRPSLPHSLSPDRHQR